MKNVLLKDNCTIHIWFTVYTIDGAGINYQKWKKFSGHRKSHQNFSLDVLDTTLALVIFQYKK